MRIERFAASDMSGAMRQVKAMFGADAVILDNARIGDRVAVLAAKDYDESLLDKLPTLTDRVMPQVTTTPAVHPQAMELKGEIAALKSTLTRELSQLRAERAQSVSVNNGVKVLQRRLNYLGFTQDFIREVIDRFRETAHETPSWQQTMAMIGEDIEVTGSNLLQTGGVVALLGATGVGKTTTAAKLAAQFARQHGKDQVAVITTDTIRIGSHEQLESYARALDIPFAMASNKSQLKSRLQKLQKRKLVLIDTAGIGQRDVHLAEHLQTLIQGTDRLKSFLVMSSTSQIGLAHEVTRAFGRIPLDAAVITKTDEAVSLGPVLSGLARVRLPVAFVCNGQRIPEDIARVSHQQLLAMVRELVDANPDLSRLLAYRGELNG